MTTTVLARRTKSIEAVRQTVADDLRKHVDLPFIGFDNLEQMQPAVALAQPIMGTMFDLIAGSLNEQGLTPEGGYQTIGQVMSGLGYDDPETAHENAHWIGCHCHDIADLGVVADRLETLNTA